MLLSQVEPGRRGRVVRISDREPRVLRELAAAGIGLDSELEAGIAEHRSRRLAIWVAALIVSVYRNFSECHR